MVVFLSDEWTDLVQEILENWRVQSGGLSLTFVDLVEVVSQVIYTFLNP